MGAISVLSLNTEATSRVKRIKSLIVANCIFDLSTVLAHKRANDDNSDDFCTVNKPIFLDIYKVFIPMSSRKNDIDQQDWQYRCMNGLPVALVKATLCKSSLRIQKQACNNCWSLLIWNGFDLLTSGWKALYCITTPKSSLTLSEVGGFIIL